MEHNAHVLTHILPCLSSMAEVSLVLKNAGLEAFKHDQYGDSINITRTFTQAGSSSYKIKSANSKLISTARSELSAILDHFQIDVDNPMNILTQGKRD
jgi:chromosome segregation ATPase